MTQAGAINVSSSPFSRHHSEKRCGFHTIASKSSKTAPHYNAMGLSITARLSLFLAIFSLLFVTPVQGAFKLNGTSSITLPPITSGPDPLYIISKRNRVRVINTLGDGWYLTGALLGYQFEGQASGDTIPAFIVIEDVIWISGGTGSTAGIYIAPDGSYVEASPGFGIGKYKIRYRVHYIVPAFPYPDLYTGLVAFTLSS